MGGGKGKFFETIRKKAGQKKSEVRRRERGTQRQPCLRRTTPRAAAEGGAAAAGGAAARGGSTAGAARTCPTTLTLVRRTLIKTHAGRIDVFRKLVVSLRRCSGQRARFTPTTLSPPSPASPPPLFLPPRRLARSLPRTARVMVVFIRTPCSPRPTTHFYICFWNLYISLVFV